MPLRVSKNPSPFLSVVVAIALLISMASPVSASSYRWRNDDGSESAASYLASENTPVTGTGRETPTRLRFGVGNDGNQNELLEKASTALLTGEDALEFAVIDTANGYAYFGTSTSPGKIVKIALGTGDAPPVRIGSLTLDPGEDMPRTSANIPASAPGVIDTVNGYAYFGTNTSPGKVVKIALGAGDALPTRVGALTLDPGENFLNSAVGDTANGYAYFGTYTSPAKVVKIALGTSDAPPTRVGAVTLNSGEDKLMWGSVIDTGNGYAYFGTSTTQGIIVKIALGTGTAPPTRVGALTLNADERFPISAAIDPANGYGYWATNDNPGHVVKVKLGIGDAPPVRVGAVTLNDGEISICAGLIDTAHGYLYFTTGSYPGYIIKVAVGVGDAPPTRVGALQPPGFMYIDSGAIDPVHGYAYFGTDTAPGNVIKVALGSGDALPTLVGSIALDPGDEHANTALIDPMHGYAYLLASDVPGRVIKMSLGTGDAPPVRVGALTLENGEDYLSGGVIDPIHGYAYLSSGPHGSPGKIVKIALGAGDAMPTRVGTLTLGVGETGPAIAVADIAHGYVYFGLQTTPSKVAKIALNGDGPPLLAGMLTLNVGENSVNAAVIDTANGYAYFGTNTFPGIVVKIALGDGDAVPSRVGAVTLDAGENMPRSAAIDAANGYGYFTTLSLPTKVVKVALGAGATPPSRIGAGELTADDNYQVSSVIDAANGYLYTGSTANKLVKILVGSGSDAPTRIGSITLNSGEAYTQAAAIDTGNGYAYFTSLLAPVSFIKVSIAPKTQFRLEYGRKSTTCADISSWTQVPAAASSSEAFQMAASSNLTDGEATTNNAGITDANVSFQFGQAKDTSSQTSFISLGEKQFTELEYSVAATVGSVFGATYCFRLTNAGMATAFSVDNYAEVTLAARTGTAPGLSGGGSVATPSITVRTPAAGTTFTADDEVGLEWTPANGAFTKYKVSYSSDNGTTWTVISDNVTSTNASWIVPDAGTTQGLIKVEGYDATSTLLATGTSGNFTVIGEAVPDEDNVVGTPPPVDSTVSGAYTSKEALENNPDFNTDMGLVPATNPPCVSGSLIKASLPSVYYCGADGKRYVFVNDKAYFSWYPDFSTVQIIDDATLANIPLGGNITYRPGSRMVKIQSDPKVYVIARGGILRWVATEAVAVRLFGANWNQMIDDVSDSFFVNYAVGTPITE